MISDRIRSLISESSRVELIMENLGALRRYPQSVVKQLLTYRKDIGPGSNISVQTFKSAAAAERAIKDNPKASFAILPPSEPAIAILTPAKSSSYSVNPDYYVMRNPEVSFASTRGETIAKVGDFLYRGSVKDIYGLFNALNKAYGKSWELHLINVDTSRLEKQAARADAKKGVEAFKRTDNQRAPYGSWSRADLMQRLDAYKKGKAPELKTPADVLKLITSSTGRFPTKFRYNGLNFELSNSRISLAHREGTLYSGMGDLNGLEYRAEWNEFYDAMKGVPDDQWKDFANTYPKYIKIHYEIKSGAFVPARVTMEQ
jgi:hypothetical protein